MFILTGFGEFGKIIQNPTSFLIEELTEDEDEILKTNKG